MKNISDIKAFVYSIELRDIYTQGHSERVGTYAREFAKFLGLDEETVQKAYVAGLLHDLGKVGVPDAILLKPGRIDPDEFKIVKLHPVLSGEIVSKIGGFSELADIIKHHHEHYDGSGYPDGLKGEEIPLLSRILALADVFDALSTRRVYRTAMSMEVTLKIMERTKNQFDPYLFEQFKKFITKFGVLTLNSFKLEKNVEQLIANNVYFMDLRFKTLNREGLLAIFKQSANMDLFGSLININIKKFREYNKKYGSHKGDDLLRKLVKDIKDYFKAKNFLENPKDGINYIARLNADKFYLFSVGSKGNFLEYKLDGFIKNFKEDEIEYKFILKNEKLIDFRDKIDYLL